MATRQPMAGMLGDQWIEGVDGEGVDGIAPVDGEMVPYRALIAQHVEAVR